MKKSRYILICFNPNRSTARWKQAFSTALKTDLGYWDLFGIDGSGLLHQIPQSSGLAVFSTFFSTSSGSDGKKSMPVMRSTSSTLFT